MRFSSRFWRSTLLATGAVLAGGSMTPARAQFFFPFFDNRPSARPDVDLRPRRQRHADHGVVDLRRPTVKRHHEKPHWAAEKKKPGAAEPEKPAEAAAPPAPEGPPPAYEPQLLRLSEIMGALAYLQTICAAPAPTQIKAEVKTPAKPPAEDAPWRERMESLMSAEGAGPARREKLAGAYNHGMRGYQFSYHVCTPSAQLARRRFLDEGARLAHDISTQYRAN